MNPRLIDLSGMKFGLLTVLEHAGKHKSRTMWLCRCSCGRECLKGRDELRFGQATDCGCVRRIKGLLKRIFKCEYRSWQSMRTRCLNPNDEHFADYGGRGIQICDRWCPRDSFVFFLADMGPRPSPKHTLDRIDVNGNYEPGNCRWATKKEQGNNRRTCRVLTVRGVSRTVAEWCSLTGRPRHQVYSRLRRGWTPEQAVLTSNGD